MTGFTTLPELTRQEPTGRREEGGQLWSRSAAILLLLIGLCLSIASLVTVLRMPGLPWHPAREAELVATYDTYRETGILLIKHSGTGSAYVQAPSAAAEFSPAAWDDDPGTYLVASLMSHVTGSISPHPGLQAAVAVLCALPLLILPTAVARLFRRARAGYAVAVLPVLMWLLNQGTFLVGTEYGLADMVASTRVYAIYGLTASMVFLSLTLLLFVSTFRLRLGALIGVSLTFVLMASAGNLLRSLSGVGIACAVGVLWWINRSGRGRLLQAIAAGAVAVAAALLIPTAAMTGIEGARASATGQQVVQLPAAHGVWHPLYLGLSYPQPITGQESVFHIVWSDDFGWNKAREISPDVLVASAEYDQIMKGLYSEQIRNMPVAAARLYVEKAVYTLEHFAAMLVLIVVSFGLIFQRRGPHRGRVALALAITIPTILFGLIPSILVMPMLYYYSELSAALALLLAVGVGGLAWVSSTLPSHARAAEQLKTAALMKTLSPPDSNRHSIVVHTRGGGRPSCEALDSLGNALNENDEILAVGAGLGRTSRKDAAGDLLALQRDWVHPCRLTVIDTGRGKKGGLRAGVLASRGGSILICADDLRVDRVDLEDFRLHRPDSLLLIERDGGSAERVGQSGPTALSRISRRVQQEILRSSVHGDPDAILVSGDWARMFATHSHGTDAVWPTEMVLAGRQQGLQISDVAIAATEHTRFAAKRPSLSGEIRKLCGLARLALLRDDFAKDSWLIADAPQTSGASSSGRARP